MGEDITITYLPLPNGEKLVSWYRHEFKSIEIGEEYFMIDGGQEDYIRYSAPEGIKPLYETLDISFNWVRDNYTYDHKKLKDLDINYIQMLINSIGYSLPKYIITIFMMELNYRKVLERDKKINSLIK